MRVLVLLPCSALLAAAAPANAAPPAIANQVAPANSQEAVTLSGGKATQAVEEEKICKQLPWTGSRLTKRACLTAKEWQQVEDDLQQ
jgi:hypothetical protein